MKSLKSAVILAVVMGTAVVGGRAEEIQLRGLSLERAYPPGQVFLHEADGKQTGVRIEVKTFLNHESEKAAVEGRSLVFTSEADPSSREDAAKVLGRIELPKGFRSGILLFLPGEKGEEGVAHLIDDSAKAFPVGSFKVVNLSSTAMRIELEGTPYECEAGKEILIEDPPVRANNSSGMRAFRKEDDEWTQVMAGHWPHPGKKRVMQVVTLNPKSKKVEMTGVRDIAKASR